MYRIRPLASAGTDSSAATRAGRSPFSPDKQHLHHRLLELGHSQRRAVLLMYGWTGLLAFTAVAEAPTEQAWRAFVRVFERKGLGRIEQASVLMYHGQPAGRLTGEFVAFGQGYR